MSSPTAGLSASFTLSRIRVAQISSGRSSARHPLHHVLAHPAADVVAREQVAARQPALEHRLQRVQRAFHLLARPGVTGSRRDTGTSSRSAAKIAFSDSTLSSGQQSMTTGPGVAPGRVQRLAQARDHVDALPQQRIELRQLQVRRTQDDAAARDLRDVVERALADEEAVDGIVGGLRMHAEDLRQMALRVEVDGRAAAACAARWRQGD